MKSFMDKKTGKKLRMVGILLVVISIIALIVINAGATGYFMGPRACMLKDSDCIQEMREAPARRDIGNIVSLSLLVVGAALIGINLATQRRS